jgi:3-isopropylmalate/(R)-2-methylmalate dehydratase small subunit
MDKFGHIKGLVAPLDVANVDTDVIIPKQFLKSIRRTGFGPNLFDAWRYLDQGEPDQDNSKRPLNKNFVLNQDRYRNAQILLCQENFGCGSSREHAPWALLDFGIKVLIGPSFADIFYNNCFKNGILPIVLDTKMINKLFHVVEEWEGFAMEVDLARQLITYPGNEIPFDIDPERKRRLLNGVDDIAATLEKSDLITAYQQRRVETAPWLFNS